MRCKRDGVPIDWDSSSLVREDAGMPRLLVGLDLLLIVKVHPSTSIKEDQLRGCVEPGIPGTEQNVVFPVPAIKLPRSFE